MTPEERAVAVCERLASEPGPRGASVSVQVSGAIAAAIRAAVAEEREAIALMLDRAEDGNLSELAQDVRARGKS